MNPDERLARLEEQMKGMREDMAELRRSLEGPPRDESIRGRLHVLETNDAAAVAARAALEAARAAQGQSWTRKERVGLFIFAGIGAVGTIVSGVVLVITQTGTPAG